ncbi:undecaprenyl-phosphate glucose phosphotransferase [Methyloglobulus sp.]|uniref:undecaprenyl-phosphate glucose phosphotransferase n=1 Tax=Methyloglobulus sp. TaxID=2518622 RepID=UPI0032B6FA73
MVSTPQSFGVIRPHSNKLAILARLLDVVVIGLTLWSIFDLVAVAWDNKHTWWLLISIVGFGVFASFNELYRGSRAMSTFTEIRLIAVSWGCVLLVMICVDQAYPLIDPIYKQYFWLWGLAVPIEIISWHVIVRSMANLVRKMGRNKRRVAIVGATMLGAELEKIFFEEETMGIDFLGFFDDRQRAGEDDYQFDLTKLTGDIEQLLKLAKEGIVDIIYITLPLRAELRIKSIVEQLSDSTVSVHYVPDLFVFDLLSSSLNNIKGIPVISIHDTPFYGVDGVMKRAFDIIFSSVALIIIAIPLVVIAVAIQQTSPGPVLFKQRRYGFRGEKIVVWKFRSMIVCEDAETVVQAKKNDPRVTKLGAFLRRTSLDELPQFFNVLQGRMSVVGPRPHAVAHNEFYRGQVKGYMLRHKVKPGITGLAQVKGYRGETDTLEKMEGRIQYDLNYIRNWSLWLDIKIVLLTIIKGFTGTKAY